MNSVRMAYTGTDVGFGPGGFGGRPEDMPEIPEGQMPSMPQGDPNSQNGESSDAFYMNDTVNSFSGVTAA